MRHPDVERWGQTGEQRIFLLPGHDGYLGGPVLTLVGRAYFSPQMMGEKLQTVADAQDGESERENGRVRSRRVRVVDRAGSSGENEPDRMMSLNLSQRGATGNDNRENVLLSYAAGDELGVLAAEIQNDDRGGIHCLVWQEARENAIRVFPGGIGARTRRRLPAGLPGRSRWPGGRAGLRRPTRDKAGFRSCRR